MQSEHPTTDNLLKENKMNNDVMTEGLKMDQVVAITIIYDDKSERESKSESGSDDGDDDDHDDGKMFLDLPPDGKMQKEQVMKTSNG